MKRKISLLLALLLLIGLVACTTEEGTPKPSSPGTTATPSTSKEPVPSETESPYAGLPITAEKTEIDVWCNWGYSGNTLFLTDWNDAVGYKAVEEKTNIRVKWTIPADGTESEQFNIMINSNDYPDLIFNFTNYYTAGLEHALDEEIIIPLDDVIQNYMPNYLSRVNVSADRQKRVKTDTGIHAAIYKILSMKQSPWGGQTIRKDWLDDLGLGIPETYNELHDTLVAFRDQKGAEKPMKLGNSGDNFNYVMAGGFGAANTMMQRDGKVYFGPMLPEFKQYLETMSDWYDEGLIDRDFPSANPFDDSDWYNNKTGYQFGFANVGTYEEVGGRSEDTDYLTIGIAGPVLNKGDVNKFGIWADDVAAGSVITTQCDQVEICARWMDYLYSDEGAVAIGFGKEGETFFFDEEGNPTVMAEALEEMYDAPFSSLQQVLGPVDGPYYSIKYMGYGLKKATQGMMMIYMEAGMTWQKDDTSALLPAGITLTADEASEYYAKINDINTLVSENVVRIITGAQSVDSFDGVVETLKEMGIERCIEIQQAALNRYNSR